MSMENIKNIVVEYIKNYDFGYDVEYLKSEKIIINEEDAFIIAHIVLSLELLDESSSENHLADMYVKINKTTKEIIDAHFKIRSH